MTYIIDILTAEKKKKTFKIEAKNEEEAKERLKLRLPPDKRESFSIESIKIDMSTVNIQDPFGTFLLDNHD
jgi:hypothetical protein